jgi:hypothetical protein
MEFTLVLLTLVGAWLVWTTPLPLQQVERGGAEQERKHYWQEQYWPRLVVLSTILSFAAILGWWSTEVPYAEQVLYSFDSQASVAGQK